MATKEQFNFFHSLYEEEERRYEQLEARAKLYLSVIAIFMATLTFKLEDVQKSIVILGAPWWLAIIEGILLAIALIFVVLGVLIREYEGIADAEKILESYGDKPPSNDSFFDDRIADYVVATGRNSNTNDKVAGYLQIAVFFLAVAMLTLLVMLFLGLFK